MDVFISYSHKDRLWKERITTYLRCVKIHGGLDYAPWDDGEIRPSEEWRQLILDAIDRCKVAVLLVSPDFLCSEFINDHEIPPLLKRRSSGQVHILPVIVRPCPWEIVDWLAKIQLHPADGNALSAGGDAQIEKDLTYLALEVHRLVSGFNEDKETVVESPPSSKSRSRKKSPKSTKRGDGFAFLREDEIRDLVEELSGETVLDTLLTFRTKVQRTWLVTTSNRMLYCLLDSENTRRSNRVLQWSMPLRPGMNVEAREQSRYKTCGLLDIEKRQNWLYSKSLHPSPSRLTKKVEDLITNSMTK